MTDTTPAELQRLLAAEFDRHGWEYDLMVGRHLVEEIEREGRVDAQTLAKRVPNDYLERNNTRRDDLAAAIERAIGGRIPVAEGAPTTLVVNDHRYSLNLGAGAQITGGNINVAGTQINIQAATPKDDVLAGVAALVRAGLAGDWNRDAARDVAGAIDSRSDITLNDIREIAGGIIKADPPQPGRIEALLNAIATSAVGGALGTGLAAGLGEALSHLPHLPI